MEFYELHIWDYDRFSDDKTSVGCRSEDFNTVNRKRLSYEKYLKEQREQNRYHHTYIKLSIVHVQFIVNEDGTINRYQMVVWGDREAGPMFTNFPGRGFYDYRDCELTEDQKTILSIQLKDIVPKLVDNLV